MLDFRLKTFLTLCDTMNYRKAAEVLNVTQPSVTQHIKYLEKYYNCKLFNYDKQRLTMTPQAMILKKYANSLYYQEKKLQQSLIPSSGEFLTIGVTKTIGEYIIPKHVINFLKPHENRILVEVDNTKTILELLDKGKIDFSIIEGYFDKSNYSSKLYKKEPFVGFCSKNHKFAGKKVSINELFDQDIVVREEGSGTRTVLEQLLLKYNYSISNFNRINYVNNFTLLQNLVANDCGITFAYLAVGEKNQSLSTFEVEGWEVSREFNYVYLKNTLAEQMVELFDEYR